MIRPHKIFYSPSKNISYIKNKNDSSSKRNDKIVTAIKKNENDLSNSTYKSKNEEINMEKKGKEVINKINDTLLFLSSKNFNEDSLKKNNTSSYSSIFVDKLKKNQKLKERNIYLKNCIKELRNTYNYNKINIIQNNQYINNNITDNFYYYNNLKKENSELNYINKNLKEEYSMLKLQNNNNLNIKNLLSNKEYLESKIKSLNYSLNSFLDILSFSSSNTEHSQPINSIKYNYLNKKKDENNMFFEKEDLKKNGLNIDCRNNKIYNINNNKSLKFTEGGNLNINESNKNEIDNDNESSEDFKIVIPLKQFEKTETNKFKNFKKLEHFYPENKINKLIFSNNNKILNSDLKSIEYNINHKTKNPKIKILNTNKNKLPFKINNQFIHKSIMNKSAKSFHLKNNRTSSNIRQNAKSKEKNPNKKENNMKHSDYILKKYNKIFEKHIK